MRSVTMCVAGQRGHDTAVDDHDDTVTEPHQLVGVGRGNQRRHPFGGGVVDQAVDLVLGADVDALGRLVEQEQLRRQAQRLAEHDLLLVATAQRADQRLGSPRS